MCEAQQDDLIAAIELCHYGQSEIKEAQDRRCERNSARGDLCRELQRSRAMLGRLLQELSGLLEGVLREDG